MVFKDGFLDKIMPVISDSLASTELLLTLTYSVSLESFNKSLLEQVRPQQQKAGQDSARLFLRKR